MSTSDFSDRLRHADLTDLMIEKDALVQRAIAQQSPIAADFFMSLPGDVWPAEAFVRSFDDNAQYEALTANRSAQEVIVLRRTIRNLIIDCTTEAMGQRRFPDEISDVMRSTEIHEHVRDLIRITMSEARSERMLRERPVDLTTTQVSVSRLSFVLRKLTDERYAERQMQLSGYETVKINNDANRALLAPPTPEQERVLQEIVRRENVSIAAAQVSLGFAHRERQLVAVARQMVQENIGTTDAHFFTTEMHGRLRDIDPENADDIMDRFMSIMSDEIGSAMARNELKTSGRTMTEEEQVEIRNAWRTSTYRELDRLVHPKDFAS